jgi:hypothetical protein
MASPKMICINCCEKKRKGNEVIIMHLHCSTFRCLCGCVPLKHIRPIKGRLLANWELRWNGQRGGGMGGGGASSSHRKEGFFFFFFFCGPPVLSGLSFPLSPPEDSLWTSSPISGGNPPVGDSQP